MRPCRTCTGATQHQKRAATCNSCANGTRVETWCMIGWASLHTYGKRGSSDGTIVPLGGLRMRSRSHTGTKRPVRGGSPDAFLWADEADAPPCDPCCRASISVVGTRGSEVRGRVQCNHGGGQGAGGGARSRSTTHVQAIWQPHSCSRVTWCVQLPATRRRAAPTSGVVLLAALHTSELRQRQQQREMNAHTVGGTGAPRHSRG